jgi:hypothetical protein
MGDYSAIKIVLVSKSNWVVSFTLRPFILKDIYAVSTDYEPRFAPESVWGKKL